MQFNELAKLLIEVRRNLAPLQEREAQLKSDITLFEGEKYTGSDGSVSVSHRTEDRTTNDIIYTLNPVRYAELSPDLKAQLEKMGVVTIAPKMIKGAAPRVTVKVAA